MEEKEILKAFGSVYDYLNDKTIYDLRTLAREFGVNAPSAARKHDLILRIIIAAAALAEPEKVSRRGARVKAGAAPAESVTEVRKLIEECRSHRPYDNYIPESERIEFNDVIKSEPVYGYGDQLYRGYVQRMTDGSWRVYPENRKNIIKIPVLTEEERARYLLREGDHVVGYVVEAAGKPPVFAQPQLVNGRLFSDPRPNFEEFAAAFPMQKYLRSRKTAWFGLQECSLPWERDKGRCSSLLRERAKLHFCGKRRNVLQSRQRSFSSCSDNGLRKAWSLNRS